MARSFTWNVADHIVRRKVEELVEQAIRDEAAAGSSDTNSIMRRFFRLVMGDQSPIREMINAIPGARFAPHVGLSLVAEYLRKNADQMFPGDTRTLVVGLRHGLRVVAPALEGTGNAGSDVLEQSVDKAVNAAKAPLSTPGTKGVLDRCRVWYVDGKAVLIIPCVMDGIVQPDALGDPIPQGLSPILMARWLSDEFVTEKTKRVKNAKGTGTHDEPIPRTKRQITGEIGFAACLDLIGGPSGLTSEQIERLEKLLAPQASWESKISPDVDRVFSWIIDALSCSSLGITSLERQEIEDLVQMMRTRRTEPDWVNRRLGRFRNETDCLPLSGQPTYDEATIGRMRTLFQRIRDEIDITLGGEQSVTTQARKGLVMVPEVLQRVKEILSNSAPWVSTGAKWWLKALIAAVVLLLIGILFPVAWIRRDLVTILIALFAIVGGIIGFAITWPTPLLQMFVNIVRGLVPGEASGLTDDGIKSLGRRIATFCLCVGTGILPFLVWFEIPVFFRVLMVSLGTLFPIGIMMGLKETGREYKAQELATEALLRMNRIVGTVAVVMFFIIGLASVYKGTFITGPMFVRWVVDGSLAGASATGSWLSGVVWWQWTLTGILLVFVGLFAIALFGRGARSDKAGDDRALTLLSMLLGTGLFLGVVVLGGWLILAGLHEVVSWFGG